MKISYVMSYVSYIPVAYGRQTGSLPGKILRPFEPS